MLCKTVRYVFHFLFYRAKYWLVIRRLIDNLKTIVSSVIGVDKVHVNISVMRELSIICCTAYLKLYFSQVDPSTAMPDHNEQMKTVGSLCQVAHTQTLSMTHDLRVESTCLQGYHIWFHYVVLNFIIIVSTSCHIASVQWSTCVCAGDGAISSSLQP